MCAEKPCGQKIQGLSGIVQMPDNPVEDFGAVDLGLRAAGLVGKKVCKVFQQIGVMDSYYQPLRISPYQP